MLLFAAVRGRACASAIFIFATCRIPNARSLECRDYMDVPSNIAGLIQWQNHTPRAGESYCLKHLHPFELTHEMPPAGNLPAVAVKIHVAFSLHTFTHKIMADDPPEDDYSDNREIRCFCHERYKYSHRLPTIVRETPTCRQLFFARALSGIANYATFDTGDGTTYAVYFDLMRFKTRGPNTVLLTVESAYVHEPGKPDTTEGRISFNALLGHALRGTKPKSPPRAR